MKSDEAKQLRDLEVENQKLKEMLAEAELDKRILKETLEGNTEPARRREAVKHVRGWERQDPKDPTTRWFAFSSLDPGQAPSQPARLLQPCLWLLHANGFPVLARRGGTDADN